MAQNIAFVTGATGFVGANLARLLLEEGRNVRVLARAGADLRNIPSHPKLEVFTGDLKNQNSISEGVRGCDEVYHVAADYRFWAKNPQEIYDSNVNGTRYLLEAAQKAGVSKFVHTSTVGTIGLSSQPQPANESTPMDPGQLTSHYKLSKLEAEKIALEFAQKGLPVVVVNPSTPIGAWDRKPTPTGQVIVDFVNGKMPAYVATGLNFVHVRDVCRGHLLAAQKGRIGERYILGHRNLKMIEFLELLAERVGRAAPKVCIPYRVAWVAGWLSTRYADYVSKTEPAVALEAVKMSKRYMFFDSSKAERELGWQQTPIELAIDDALNWFLENGYFETQLKLIER
jgi:dihydroflavonol-4-reductase